MSNIKLTDTISLQEFLQNLEDFLQVRFKLDWTFKETVHKHHVDISICIPYDSTKQQEKE